MKPNNEAVLREALEKIAVRMPDSIMSRIAKDALAATATVAKEGGEVMRRIAAITQKYQGMKPEAGEGWEEWYVAALDLIVGEIEPVIAAATTKPEASAEQPAGDVVAWRYKRSNDLDGEWHYRHADQVADELRGADAKGFIPLLGNDSYHSWEPLSLAAPISEDTGKATAIAKKDYCARASTGECSCRKFFADPDRCENGVTALPEPKAMFRELDDFGDIVTRKTIHYTADQMHAHAHACIAADRATRQAPATGSIGEDAELRTLTARHRLALNDTDYDGARIAWQALVAYIDTRAAASRNAGVETNSGSINSSTCTTAPDTSAPADSSSAAPSIKTWQERCTEAWKIDLQYIDKDCKLNMAINEIADLRAALAPSPKGESLSAEVLACWSCKRPYTAEQRMDADGMCPHCGVEIELDDAVPGEPT